MTESVYQIHLFYPLLFIVIIVAIVTFGIVFRGKSSDKKDTQIFVKSSDNAKDVTLKVTNDMKDMHHDIVEHTLPKEYENEIHALEVMVREINDKLDKVIKDVTELKQASRTR